MQLLTVKISWDERVMIVELFTDGDAAKRAVHAMCSAECYTMCSAE